MSEQDDIRREMDDKAMRNAVWIAIYIANQQNRRTIADDLGQVLMKLLAQQNREKA